jgi:hypothetical protein
MTELIACLSIGKGTWGHVARLMNDGKWERVFLITNDFGKQNFKNESNADMIVIDQNKSIADIRDDVYNQLKDRIKGTEVALNFVSGTGEEHMALLSAVLKLGVGIRLVALTKEGTKEV